MRIKKYLVILICVLLTVNLAYAGSIESAKYADDVGLQKLRSEIQTLSVSDPQEWHKLQTKILYTGNNGEIIRGEFIKELVLGFVETGLTHIIFANATVKQPAPISKARYTQPSYGNAAGKGGTTVIGRVKDLQSLAHGEKSLLDRLPNLGNPKANWKQNSGVLRQEMNKLSPILDKSPGDTAGQFLNAERSLLQSRGWTFDSITNFWNPPVSGAR